MSDGLGDMLIEKFSKCNFAVFFNEECGVQSVVYYGETEKGEPTGTPTSRLGPDDELPLKVKYVKATLHLAQNNPSYCCIIDSNGDKFCWPPCV